MNAADSHSVIRSRSFLLIGFVLLWPPFLYLLVRKSQVQVVWDRWSYRGFAALAANLVAILAVAWLLLPARRNRAGVGRLERCLVRLRQRRILYGAVSIVPVAVWAFASVFAFVRNAAASIGLAAVFIDLALLVVVAEFGLSFIGRDNSKDERRRLLFRSLTASLVAATCLVLVIGTEFVLRLQRVRAIDEQLHQIELAEARSGRKRVRRTEQALLENVVRSNAVYAARQQADGYRPQEVYRPFIEWRRTPGRASETITINSLGYRGPEFSITKPPETYRILIYGGSFVFGIGADSNETTIAGHLQRMLDDRSPGSKRVEVINCGGDNYCSTQETVYLLIEGTLLSPDLVIFIDGVNDTAWGYSNLPAGYHGDFYRFNRRLSRTPTKSLYSIPDRELLKTEREHLFGFEHCLLLQRTRRLIDPASIDSSALVRDATPRDLELVTDVRSPDEYALRTFHNMKCVRALGAEFGFRSLFLTQPVPVLGKPLHSEEIKTLRNVRRTQRWIAQELQYWEDHYKEYLDSLLARCKRAGYPIVDLSSLFQNNDSRLYVDDCHLTGEGYRLVAERIYRELRERKLPAESEKNH
ncbi:MAG: hypothetical protein ACE5KM_01160 [Planctomycetaceae bacterium]